MSDGIDLTRTTSEPLFWHQSLLWTPTNAMSERLLGDAITHRRLPCPISKEDWLGLDATASLNRHCVQQQPAQCQSARQSLPDYDMPNASDHLGDLSLMSEDSDDFDELFDSIERFESIPCSAEVTSPSQQSSFAKSSGAFFLPTSAEFRGSRLRALPSRRRLGCLRRVSDLQLDVEELLDPCLPRTQSISIEGCDDFNIYMT
jgi:hypothetical protein